MVSVPFNFLVETEDGCDDFLFFGFFVVVDDEVEEFFFFFFFSCEVSVDEVEVLLLFFLDDFEGAGGLIPSLIVDVLLVVLT